MRRSLFENGLAIAMLVFFAYSLAGQIGTGWVEANDDRAEHAEPAIALGAYLSSGHFVEALFENWESEFLQMGALVVLTIRLRQRGSPESKSLDGDQPVDREPDPERPRAPWPVRQGGLALTVYDHSLSLALFV